MGVGQAELGLAPVWVLASAWVSARAWIVIVGEASAAHRVGRVQWGQQAQSTALFPTPGVPHSLLEQSPQIFYRSRQARP